jgi:hypothetical protein
MTTGEVAAPAASGRPPSPWRERFRAQAGWVALLGALAAWGGWFIFRTSFVVDGRRVFCLFDDAMISMTYARNLVEGYGLNWARQGAPVEGFTHPLWTALMVPVNLLPLALDRRSLVVQLGSLALLLAHLWLVRRLMQRHFTLPGARHWAPACVLTAFYYPLAYWALMGMETGLQALLTTASVLLALDTVHGRRDRRLALLLVGTLAVLLRMDMVLLVAVTQIYVLAGGGSRDEGGIGREEGGWRRWRRWLRWRRGWRGTLAGAAVLAAATGGYELFRWRYFHALLPNTYYLKVGGIPLPVRLLRGGSVMLDMVRAHGLLLAAAAVGVVPQLAGALGGGASGRGGAGGDSAAGGGDRQDAGAGGADRQDEGGAGGADRADLADPSQDARGWASRLALPAAVFVVCCLYSVYVGGDVWESSIRANRFVAYAMPLVFVLLNALANQVLAAARRRRLAVAGPDEAGSPLGLRCALAAATVAALLAANGLWPAEQQQEAWRVFMAVDRPLHVSYHQVLLDKVRSLQQIAAPAASVAVVWAGIPAYFSDFRMVDQLGYNDSYIARQPPLTNLDEDNYQIFLPGHMKCDAFHVLDDERPDVFLQQLWGVPERRAARLLRSRGYRRIEDGWFLKASPRLQLPPPEAHAAAPAGNAGL